MRFTSRVPVRRRRSGRSLTSSLAVAAALTTALAGQAVIASPLAAAPSTPVTVGQKRADWVLRDAHGREVVLRGFNVAASTKLYENGLLPFRSTADAVKSAQAMRDLTGANAVRLLVTWEGVNPAPGKIDYAYLDKVVAQIQAFADRGVHVLLDYHQDLYSRWLFNSGSWYTGDGAPKWVIENGGYPQESCGICFLWGQNMQTNNAVRKAMYDFWRNRVITTPAGQVAVQDAYVSQATSAMTYLRQKLSTVQFEHVVGLDPFNEPFDGGLDGGSGVTWEKNYLMPFYQRMRAAMDTAGWNAKPAFVEPLVFWNPGFMEEGGMTTVGTIGTRFVFNSHFYDGARMVIDPSPAGDGTYAGAMNEIRDRARTVGTAPFVSEYGNKMSGSGSDRTPWMIRAMYQAMDSGVKGAEWWTKAENGGTVLSSTQWHWDIYSGKHNELMNGNASKVKTEGDAWNDEDFSVVKTDSAGAVTLRLDARVLDRLYPAAVSGDTLAFTYEDLARSGFGGTGTQTAWLAAPSGMPNVAALIKGRQAGVLVWRTTATASGDTEMHLPKSFTPAGTAVVSDLGTVAGLPSSGAVRVALEAGSPTANRLLLTSSAGAGTVHVALVVNATGGTVTQSQLTAAAAELASWKAQRFPAG